MTDIVYDYEHVPTIRRFSESRKFLRGLMGPFGSGKSSGCVMELVDWGMRQNKGRDGKRHAKFVVVRNTYPQLKDTTMATVEHWLPWPHFGDFRADDHRYVINRLHPELELELLFRALDRPEHVANLLSLEMTGAWVNEAREVPRAIIRALQGRVGRYPAMTDGGCVDPGIIMDTNPPDDENWWYQLFEVDRPANAELFKQPSGRSEKAENLPYLRKGYYDDLMAGADEDFVKVYVDGEYGVVQEGKPVYPEYRDSLHQQDIDYSPGAFTILRGWDFGLTPACVFAGVLPGGRIVVFDELTADSIGVHAFADTVLLHCAQRYPDAVFEDIGDPAGMARSSLAKPTEEQSAFEILRGKGIKILPGEQTLTTRLGSVKLALTTLIAGRPQFILHSRCHMLRRGFQGRYQYKRIKVTGAAERFHDVPDKNEFSHPHDALQYIMGRLLGAKLKARQERKHIYVAPQEAAVGGWMR